MKGLLKIFFYGTAILQILGFVLSVADGTADFFMLWAVLACISGIILIEDKK
jgi:hypothetical protein